MILVAIGGLSVIPDDKNWLRLWLIRQVFPADSAASSCIGVENQTIEPVFVEDCERDVKVEVCVR